MESSGDVSRVPEYAGAGIFAYSDGGFALEACLTRGSIVRAQGARAAAIFMAQFLCAFKRTVQVGGTYQ